MSKHVDEVAARVGEALQDTVRAHLERLEADGLGVSVADLSKLGDQLTLAATDVTMAELQLRTAGTSAVARRIGPVYTVDDLTRWLPIPGAKPYTGEAVRKRAKQRRLVAFRSDDRHWAFPAWQFDRLGGQLRVRGDVIAVWHRLPADGFLTDADLAAWMATRQHGLDGTPAEHAHRHGHGSAALAAAVSRLVARAA